MGVLLLPGKSMRSPPPGHSGAVCLLFLWVCVATDATICGTFVSWDLCFADEEACVGAFDVSDALE